MKRKTVIYYILVIYWLTIIGYGYCLDKYSLGVILGVPTGVDLKIQNTKDTFIELSLNFDTQINFFELHLEYLKQNYKLIPKEELSGDLPVFWGPGIYIITQEKMGLKFTLGVEYIFKEIPFNIFVKISPCINIVPSISVYFAPSIGIRYIFR